MSIKNKQTYKCLCLLFSYGAHRSRDLQSRYSHVPRSALLMRISVTIDPFRFASASYRANCSLLHHQVVPHSSTVNPQVGQHGVASGDWGEVQAPMGGRALVFPDRHHRLGLREYCTRRLPCAFPFVVPGRRVTSRTF